MFYVLLTIVALASIAIYLLFILETVPGAKEERLGAPEPLPEDVGKWRVDSTSSEGKAAIERGLQREERLFVEEGQGLFAHDRVVHQVRYRNALNGEIEAVEPEHTVRRRRIRS